MSRTLDFTRSAAALRQWDNPSAWRYGRVRRTETHGKEATRVRRNERKNIVSGVAHVNSTFNNTMITITDAQGNTISWSSAGTMGFKGSRKSTPFAAQMAAEDAVRKAAEHGMRMLEVEVSGPVRAANRRSAPFRRRASTSPRSAT